MLYWMFLARIELKLMPKKFDGNYTFEIWLIILGRESTIGIMK
jgi:hypothetical protein